MSAAGGRGLDRLIPILRCVDCASGGLSVVDDPPGLGCASCGRTYPVAEGGILSMPPSRPLPRPAVYDDPDYVKFYDAFEKDAAAVYYSEQNRLFHAIHHWAHKKLKRMADDAGAPGVELDLGCGTGDHLGYFDEPGRAVGLDMSMGSLKVAAKRYPDVMLIQGDACALPFADGTVGRVFSIHNLEHLYYLDEALSEVSRVLADGGRFYVGIPTEGGLAWDLGRKLSTERIYSKRYGVDYGKVMRIDHCNSAAKVLAACGARFRELSRSYFPLPVLPSINLNLVISAEYEKL